MVSLKLNNYRAPTADRFRYLHYTLQLCISGRHWTYVCVLHFYFVSVHSINEWLLIFDPPSNFMASSGWPNSRLKVAFAFDKSATEINSVYLEVPSFHSETIQTTICNENPFVAATIIVGHHFSVVKKKKNTASFHQLLITICACLRL